MSQFRFRWSALRLLLPLLPVLATTVACGSTHEDPAEPSLGSTASGLEATRADLTWVANVLPVVLGRRARGPGELLALANAVNQRGRAPVLEHLMDSREFIDRWTSFMIERFRIGRDNDGTSWNFTSCYGNAIRDTPDAWLAAASAVLNQPVESPLPSSTQQYNMTDIIRGAIAGDDLLPAYRGYLFTLPQRSTRNNFDSTSVPERGELFTQTFLNRSPTCIGCHHSGWSVTGTDHSFIFPGGAARYGGFPELAPGQDPRPAYESKVFPGHSMVDERKFEPDRWAVAFASPPADAAAYPFPGWHDGCGRLGPNTPAPPGDGTPATASGLLRSVGTTQNIWQLDRAFMEGVNSGRYDVSAASLADDDGPRIAALSLAAAFTNDVWQEVMGHSLTISNYMSRNPAQFSELTELAREVGMPGSRGRISLRRVLSTIVGSAAFNRSLSATSPKLFEPFLEEPPGNDYGSDRIHRYSADVLLRSGAYALGTTAPSHVPGTFPTLAQAKALGMGLSPLVRAAPRPSLEGMLGWEATLASCRAPAGGNDWVDALVTYGESDPTLTVRDVVDALEFRIVSAPTSDDAERAAIADLLGFGGSDLSGGFLSSTGDHPTRVRGLRDLCSVLMKTPDFMLGGGSPAAATTIEAMRIKAGDLGVPHGTPVRPLTIETENEACLSWHLNELGNAGYSCDPAVREQGRYLWTVTQQLRGLCPDGRCWSYEKVRIVDKLCARCPMIDVALLQPPRDVDPRSKAHLGGEPLPPFVNRAQTFLAWAPGAKVVGLSQSIPLRRASGQVTKATPGTQLAFGDALDIPPGVYLKLQDDDGFVFETPQKGLPYAPDKGTWTFMVTGPEAITPPPVVKK
jgi:hypothetical protein